MGDLPAADLDNVTETDVALDASDGVQTRMRLKDSLAVNPPRYIRVTVRRD